MRPLTVVFRADASVEIGTGHVLRCLTFAEALRLRGVQCQFVCREHCGHLLDDIANRGFAVCALPMATDHCEQADLPGSAWLGADWMTDAQQTLGALGGRKADWLVVDHYSLDICWQRAVRTAFANLMVIDDLADRDHDCDLLLDQNLRRTINDYAGRVPANCAVLTGPRYALLRPEFGGLREHSLAKRRDAELRQLFVSFGGVDKDNFTGRVLRVLQTEPLPAGCRITVAMGPKALWLDDIRRAAETTPYEVELVINSEEIAHYMARSDLAVGAAGSTSWERCCLGLPAIVTVLAANQDQIAQSLTGAGAAWSVRSEDLETQLPDLLRLASSETPLLRSMSLNASAITDGRGTETVVQSLLEYRHENIHPLQ
jgi:UDP-2,4-diacetamido-2,4,6-trideoxy-beta-L-altropyranose hydrolase